MYGLNAVAFVFFCCINLIACRLCKCAEPVRKKLLTSLCIALLALNLIRYGILFPFVDGVVRIPAEFSTVAYFAVPTILLLGRRKLYSWAAYSGLMAGFFYYLGLIAAGGPLYASSAPRDVYISMFCHGSIYLCGFVALGTEVFRAKDAPRLALGVAAVAVRALIVRPLVHGSEGMLIYILLDAVCVKRLLPESIWNFALPIYYIAIALFVLLTIRGFFRKNQRQYHRFATVCAAA